MTDLGHHPLLVGHPFGELLDVLFDLVVLCMEDVYSILGCPDAVLVNKVVAVAANMVPLINHQNTKIKRTKNIKVFTNLKGIASPKKF